MKKNIHKKVFELLKSKGVLAVSSAFLLVSCVVYPGGYSETDGVYYDPNKDTLPEGAVMTGGNQVGQHYDYQNSNYPLDQNDIVYDRYKDWNGNSTNNATQYPSSDWGDYTGTVTNYYDSGWYGGFGYWGSPWGYYGGFGSGFGWGWNSWNVGFGFGWGSPYGWYGGYNPYWNYGWGWGNPYNNWYGYNPYWGGGYYGNYWGSQYGYNSYNAPGFVNRRSGANGRLGGNTGGRNAHNNAGFRSSNGANSNNSGFRNQGNSGFRNQNDSGRFRNNSTTRTNTRNQDYQQRTQPSYNTPRSNDNGGFRSSGSNSGGFRSGGSGMSSGSSRSGGGGGFRR